MAEKERSGICCANGDMRARNGTVLRIMDNALDLPKDGGMGSIWGQDRDADGKNQQTKQILAGHCFLTRLSWRAS